MAVIRWNFPNGNDGDTLTAPLAGADTTNFAAGTPTLSNVQTLSGMNTLSARFTLNAVGHLWYAKEGLSATSYAYDLYVYIVTRMGGNVYIGWAGLGSAPRSLGIVIGAQNNVILNDGAGTVYSSGNEAFPDNAWIRFSVFGTCGAGTGTGRLAWYLGHDTTPLGDTGLLTNLSTQTSIDRIRIGGKAATSSVASGEVYIGSWAYDTTATELIGPYNAGVSVAWLAMVDGAWASVTARKRQSGGWQPLNSFLK